MHDCIQNLIHFIIQQTSNICSKILVPCANAIKHLLHKQIFNTIKKTNTILSRYSNKPKQKVSGNAQPSVLNITCKSIHAQQSDVLLIQIQQGKEQTWAWAWACMHTKGNISPFFTQCADHYGDIFNYSTTLPTIPLQNFHIAKRDESNMTSDSFMARSWKNNRIP